MTGCLDRSGASVFPALATAWQAARAPAPQTGHRDGDRIAPHLRSLMARYDWALRPRYHHDAVDVGVGDELCAEVTGSFDVVGSDLGHRDHHPGVWGNFLQSTGRTGHYPRHIPRTEVVGERSLQDGRHAFRPVAGGGYRTSDRPYRRWKCSLVSCKRQANQFY